MTHPNQKVLQRGHTRWKHPWKEHTWLLTAQNWCHPCRALQRAAVTELVLPWIKVVLSLRPGMGFEIISTLLSSQSFEAGQAILFSPWCFRYFFLGRWAPSTAAEQITGAHIPLWTWTLSSLKAAVFHSLCHRNPKSLQISYTSMLF